MPPAESSVLGRSWRQEPALGQMEISRSWGGVPESLTHWSQEGNAQRPVIEDVGWHEVREGQRQSWGRTWKPRSCLKALSGDNHC